MSEEGTYCWYVTDERIRNKPQFAEKDKQDVGNGS